MPNTLKNTNYEPGAPRDETASPSAAAASRPAAPPKSGQAAASESRSWTAPDLPAIQEFLTLLARAIRQFHTYPATSPLCIDAITACRNALIGLQTRDRVVFRVTPHELVVDESSIGAGTIIEHEIVRRLHRARVANVDVDRAATARDLSRFSDDVRRCDEYAKTNVTLAEARLRALVGLHERLAASYLGGVA